MTMRERRWKEQNLPGVDLMDGVRVELRSGLEVLAEKGVLQEVGGQSQGFVFTYCNVQSLGLSKAKKKKKKSHLLHPQKTKGRILF